jgi:hypothetical protein
MKNDLLVIDFQGSRLKSTSYSAIGVVVDTLEPPFYKANTAIQCKQR